MPWWLWIILIVFIVVFVMSVIFVFGEKQNKKQKTIEDDRELLEKMTNSVDLLIAMCGSNVFLCEKMESLQENLKYCLPSDNQRVYKIDQSLDERVTDLKLSVSRAISKQTFHSVMKFISQIELLIIERNSLLK